MIRTLSQSARKAAELICDADSLLITAGAGMGIDSGLPDFRGPGGFWGVYPALGRANIRFHEIASPQAFMDRPAQAWGFYGHRLNLYRATIPHEGFRILRRFADLMPDGAFVYTSNVDGQFLRAGFSDRLTIECHGSIHYLQCTARCMGCIWPAEGFQPVIDEENSRIISEMPVCPQCNSLARPNILMFGDWGWFMERTEVQQMNYNLWRNAARRTVVIELGAGLAIPTVREFGESQDCPMIRINPEEAYVRDPRGVSMACGALEGLLAISKVVDEITGRGSDTQHLA